MVVFDVLVMEFSICMIKQVSQPDDSLFTWKLLSLTEHDFYPRSVRHVELVINHFLRGLLLNRILLLTIFNDREGLSNVVVFEEKMTLWISIQA